MSYASGDAAEQIVRMSLEGSEVAIRLAGAGAKELALLLYTVLREQNKTRGKARLSSMLRSGKELKVFAVKDSDLKLFCREAKKYGVLYCVLKDRDATDGITDIMVRAEDASKINRIFDRFALATVDMASVKQEIERGRENKAMVKEDVTAPEPKEHRTTEQEAEAFLDALFKPSPEPEGGKTEQPGNPTEGRTVQSHPSEPTSKPSGTSARGTSEPPERSRPSVRKELEEIKAEQKQNAADKGREKNSPQRLAQHKAPPRKRGKKKER